MNVNINVYMECKILCIHNWLSWASYFNSIRLNFTSVKKKKKRDHILFLSGSQAMAPCWHRVGAHETVANESVKHVFFKCSCDACDSFCNMN